MLILICVISGAILIKMLERLTQLYEEVYELGTMSEIFYQELTDEIDNKTEYARLISTKLKAKWTD